MLSAFFLQRATDGKWQDGLENWRGFAPCEDAPLHNAFSSSFQLLYTKEPSPSAAGKKYSISL